MICIMWLTSSKLEPLVDMGFSIREIDLEDMILCGWVVLYVRMVGNHVHQMDIRSWH